MDKDMVYVCVYGMLLSHRKEQNGVICSDVDEPRVWSLSRLHLEWSQKAKNKCHILTYDIQKNGTEPICRVGIQKEWGVQTERAALINTHNHV